MSFAENYYQVIENIISNDLAKFLITEFEIIKKVKYITNNKHESDIYAFNDPMVSKCFGQYSPLCFETLSLILMPKIEEVVGVMLHPTYSYGRIYFNGAKMDKHIDRPSCEYSVSICVSIDGNSEPWDIWFQDKNGREFPITLKPNDGVVYKGDFLYHWRNIYTGNKQCQAFLHYVDRNGCFQHHKYDNRHYLGFSTRKKI